jgi:hypothetical protein
LQQEAKELHQRCQEVRTVKQLKQHLNDRLDVARFHEQLMSIDPHNFFSEVENEW